MAAVKFFNVVQILVFILAMFKCVISHSDRRLDDDLVIQLIDKVENMQVKIDKLEKNNRDLKQSVSTLIGTTAKFRIQIEELTNKLVENENMDAEKSERIKELEDKLAEIRETGKNSGAEPEIENEADTENYGALIDDINSKNDNRSLIRKEKRQTPDNVAFTAYLDHVIRNLGTDQPVVYNQILLNDGGAYSDKTGIFRVPVSGVYLLSWSATARKLPGEHNYDVWVKLVVNGSHKVVTMANLQFEEIAIRMAHFTKHIDSLLGVVAESRADADDNQGSNSAVLRLNQGDEVWTSHYSSYPDMFGDDNERTTSFMGVLLYVDQ